MPILAVTELFAGISWDPGIRGILTVAVGVAVLMGSVYLILATNTGARLGMLIALTGLFGWLVILTLFWWISPPGIGPRGNGGAWEPVEVIVDDGSPPETEVVASLPRPEELPTPEQILADHPELAEEYPNGFILGDLAANNPDILEQYVTSDTLNGWKVTGTSSAGEAQAAADVALVESGFFGATSEYEHLDVFQVGGKPTRLEYCPDAEGGSFLPDDPVCRVQYKLKKLFTFTHPTHYAVVRVQAVVPQETVPGEAPPLPVVDESQPVVEVVLVRDLGDVRLIPFLYFVICLSLFVIFAWMLHSRDKTLMKNKALAEAAAEGD
jgi:hypothetical protein